MPVKAPSSERLNVRLTSAEKFVLHRSAVRLGLSLTDYLMYCVQLEINSHRHPSSQIDFFADKKARGAVPSDFGLY